MNSGKNGRGFIRSGEMARLAEVSADTLRHYERLGLVAKPRRSANGYREYPPEVLDRVRLVQRGLGMGFTLKKLAQFLKVRDKGGVPCLDVRRLAAAKLQEVEQQMANLSDLRDELRDMLERWDSLLAERADGERAGLLESLNAGKLRDARRKGT